MRFEPIEDYSVKEIVDKYNSMTDEEKLAFEKKIKTTQIISYIFTGVIAVVVIIFAIALVKKRKK